jgi:isoquinoline 1-oxidoreductase subunit beta
MTVQIDRRSFLASITAVGGSLSLGFEVPFGPAPAAANSAPEITAWIVIGSDDTVTIRVAKSEMGQGSFTALPMLVAEELECDWNKVRAEFAPPHENLARNRVWGDMSTGGSRSIRSSHEFLRKAGATAREMLIAAAAQRWNVTPSECRAANSTITHVPTGRTLRYGEVAEAAATAQPLNEVALKNRKDWKLVGKPTKRLDIIDKVQGTPIYGIDVRLPGMLHAALIQCPVFKGTLKSVDDTRARAMPGVRKVVKLKDAVAVVADSWWQAKKASEALAITWDEGGNGKISSPSIREFLRTGLDAADAGVGRRDGDVVEGLARAAKRVQAEYEVPFLGHATLEPQNCTAHVVGDKVEIWVPTQNGEAALAAAAQAAGVSPRNVVVHKMMLGGGFGRRGAVQDYIPPAVLIAKEMGVPVQTLWSREEDMRHDFYRPVAMARMTAGLDADGLPTAWHVRLSGNSILGTLTPFALRNSADTQFQEGFLDDMVYDVPNYLADYAMRNTHVPVGFWRGVSHTQNDFFRECFIDELAQAAGIDPYQYRLRLLGKHPQADKVRAALVAAVASAKWDQPPAPGRFRGIAAGLAYGTSVAGVVEVSVSDVGELRVHRVVVAISPGHVVNPLTVELQTQSAVVFGLTAALYGEITIKDGRVEQSNFHDYAMLRMADMPQIETVIMSSHDVWGGVGEPPIAIVAPALCNAVFAATGKRIRSLPLKNHDLSRA